MMKQLIFSVALVLTMSQAQAQSVSDSSIASTLSPFVSAAAILDSVTSSAISPFATTMAGVEGRGVAGREQLKDELLALNEDIAKGVVRTIDDVRQPGLKELFKEIAADQEKMEEIDEIVPEGPDLHRIATAVTIGLLAY